MKVLLAILLISFFPIGAHGTRARRGLSADEQKKFLEELNKDRQKIGKKLGYSTEPMKYSLKLEKVAESLKCELAHPGSGQAELIALQFNDVAAELYEYIRENGADSIVPFFYPSGEIGCSKTYKCSKKFRKEELGPDAARFAGKEAIVHGACVVHAPFIISREKFIGQGLPRPPKYGNLLGVPKPATSVLGFRVKRGLSADQQKKLVDALNKDRQEVGKKAGLEMEILTYDTRLEEKANGVKCGKKDFEVATLQHNSVYKELYNKYHKGILGTLGRRFFWPTAYRIGCTTTYKCSEQITVKESEDFGKTIAVQGLCVLGHASTLVRDGAENALKKTGFPEPSKYADIIGIPKQVENSGQSAGNVARIILSLFLIFYI